jgi:hypothetical protein
VPIAFYLWLPHASSSLLCRPLLVRQLMALQMSVVILRCLFHTASGAADQLLTPPLLVLQNFYQDIHDVAHTEGTQTKVVHDRAEVFDIKAEALFRYLQVRFLLPSLASHAKHAALHAQDATVHARTACCCYSAPFFRSVLSHQFVGVTDMTVPCTPRRSFQRASCPSRTAPTMCPTPWAPLPLCTRSGAPAKCPAT